MIRVDRKFLGETGNVLAFYEQLLTMPSTEKSVSLERFDQNISEFFRLFFFIHYQLFKKLGSYQTPYALKVSDSQIVIHDTTSHLNENEAEDSNLKRIV